MSYLPALQPQPTDIVTLLTNYPDLLGRTSVNSLLKLSQRHDLTIDELEQVLTVQQQFGASLNKVGKLLTADFTVAQIYDLYSLRYHIQECLAFYRTNISLKALAKIVQTFPGSTTDNLDAEVLVAYYTDLRQLPGNKYLYFDQFLHGLCQVGKLFNIAQLEAAVLAYLDHDHWDQFIYEDYP